jgi:type II secretory pathway pseudopilin PulG
MGQSSRTGEIGPAAAKGVGSEGAGYAMVMALLLLAIASLGVMLAVQIAQTDARRERELELLFVGDQYRQALIAYASAPGVPQQYPQRLEDLLEDHRLPATRRYLRRLYPDPITDSGQWGLDLFQGRIVGVHTLSQGEPLIHGNFPDGYGAFEKAKTYADWKFNGPPPAAEAPPGAPASP